MKSEHPEYFRKVTERLISKDFQELFITADTTTPSEKSAVRSAFNSLQLKCSSKYDMKDLAYLASKNLYDYASNCDDDHRC